MGQANRGSVEHIRANVRRLTIIFVVAAVVTAGIELAAVGALRRSEPLAPRIVLQGIVLALLIGVVAVLVAVLSICGRMMPDVIPLNVVPSERRREVGRAVRLNRAASIREPDRSAALEYARAFERNTPLTLLQLGLMVVIIVLLGIDTLALGSFEPRYLVNTLLFVALFAVVVSNFIRRLRDAPRVRLFIDAEVTTK